MAEGSGPSDNRPLKGRANDWNGLTLGETMEYRKATRSDLAKIYRDCSERMLIEYERAGFTRRQAKDEFTKWVDAGSAQTLLLNGEPLAIISWFAGDGIIQTAFAAKEEFFQRRTVRFCHSHIRKIQRDNGGLPLCSSSSSPHPRVPKWFKTLGFIVGPSEPPTTNYWLMPGT